MNRSRRMAFDRYGPAARLGDIQRQILSYFNEDDGSLGEARA